MTKNEILALRFKSLSHPNRVRIMRILAQQPTAGQTFSTLKAASGMSGPTFVHHLREMERCGLLRRKRRGTFVSYFLVESPLAHAMCEVQFLLSQPTATQGKKAA